MKVLATLYLTGIVYVGYLMISGHKTITKETIDLSEDYKTEQNKCRMVKL